MMGAGSGVACGKWGNRDDAKRLWMGHRACGASVASGGGLEQRQDHAPKVVVALAGQLLRRELQHLRQLARQRARVREAVADELDLRDELEVRYHHRDGAEQRLQVVGQLRPPRVAGVHRDEGVCVGVERERRALEHKR